jgi:hypothetical protein
MSRDESFQNQSLTFSSVFLKFENIDSAMDRRQIRARHFVGNPFILI